MFPRMGGNGWKWLVRRLWGKVAGGTSRRTQDQIPSTLWSTELACNLSAGEMEIGRILGEPMSSKFSERPQLKRHGREDTLHRHQSSPCTYTHAHTTHNLFLLTLTCFSNVVYACLLLAIILNEHAYNNYVYYILITQNNISLWQRNIHACW